MSSITDKAVKSLAYLTTSVIITISHKERGRASGKVTAADTRTNRQHKRRART